MNKQGSIIRIGWDGGFDTTDVVEINLSEMQWWWRYILQIR
jgi:hypothetical protein